MELPAFEYHRPETALQVVELLARYGDDADVVAGGTDLLPNYKNRLNAKPHVVSLAGVRGLARRSPGYLGALVRLVEIERDDDIAAKLPVLRETVKSISSPPLREHGTVGGNLMLDTRCYYFNQSPMWRESKSYCLKAEGTECLVVPNSTGACYATYSGELGATLMVLGADLDLLGPDGPRRVPIERFFHPDGIVRFQDPRRGEILIGVAIPEAAQKLQAGYMKLRIRDSIDFPSLGIAVAVRVGDDDRIEELRVANTAMTGRPESFDAVVGGFEGKKATADIAAEIGSAVQRASIAYRNVPLDPKYRKKMSAVFVRRILARLDPRFAETA
jgi:4-hydroxybenzoyl-CoA reductase subunit beta